MVGIAMYADIQKLKALGYKKQRVAKQLRIDAKTVRKYWSMTDDEYISYHLDTKERTKILDPYSNYILDKIKTYPDITSAIIYDNLREDFHDFAPSYRSVRLYVRNLREKEGLPLPARIRQYGETPELPFGYQAQVDLGKKTMKDMNGNPVKIHIFAMVLSSSRYKFICFQLQPFDAKTFVEAHDKAFRFFGGRPSEIVYDQDRVMVVSENAGDIIYTETFENYKTYAGFSIHLCRGSDPESKGKIEAVIKYVKNNFLSCRIFHGLGRLNSDGIAWLERTGNGLVHETTKMIPSVVFMEEQKHLKPFPELSEPSIIPRTAIIRKNNVVMYRQNRYCLPKGTYQPGKKVRIEADESAGNVSFFDLESGALLEEHPIPSGIGKCVRSNHPERDRSIKLQTLRSNVIAAFGSEVAEKYVQRIEESKPRYIRDQLGILRKLQEQYSKEELYNAVDYCLQRKLFSAVDLKDTLEYFKMKAPTPILSPVKIPIKYSLVIAQTRSIEAYTNLYSGGETR